MTWRTTTISQKKKQKPVLSESLQHAAQILKELKLRADSGPFLEPVDWVLYNLPDYPKIIKNPMDLGTIQENLETGKFKTIEDFAAPVRLVWKNAMTYNRKDSAIYADASLLSKFFERKLKKAMKILAKNANSKNANSKNANSKNANSKSANSKNSNSKTTSTKKQNTKKQNTKKQSSKSTNPKSTNPKSTNPKSTNTKSTNSKSASSKSLVPKNRKRKSSSEPLAVTQRNRRRLGELVVQLTNDELRMMAEILQKDCPAALNTTKEDIEIEINDIDPVTLRSLNELYEGRIAARDSTKIKLSPVDSTG